MGLFSSSSPANLQPFQPPLGVNLNYAVPQPTTLVLKERAFTFSGDDYQVKDAAGVTVCRIEGKAIGFGDKKNFKDTNGNRLFQLRTKMLALRKTFVATDGNDKELFVVKKKFALMGSKMVATFTNASDNREIELVCRGNIIDKQCTVTVGDDERPVATISRQVMNMREMFTDNQTYYVTVAPNVDLVLMAALAVCFDECEHEGN